MTTLFYNAFNSLYPFVAKGIAPFNSKARLWIQGRKNIFEKIEVALKNTTGNIIWIHCASLGEFEQGRPVIEMIKERFPSSKILLTFFSPSGYEVQKGYPKADYIFYLPMDSKSNATRFLSITNPTLIIFIKYEFWFYYLNEAKKKRIPLLLVSAIFRHRQPFFRPYGKLYKEMLNCFTHLFVQNQESLDLLHSINFKEASVAGDTRFDRVLTIAKKFEHIAAVETFCKNKQVIVAGSTWTEDDEELDHFVNTRQDIRFIIAPHAIDEARLKECTKLYRNSILYSAYIEALHKNEEISNINTLIIDNIGMLSRLYNYATVCYVGGAFGGDGVHNVLEAAVYGKPVVFGPVFDKYAEAVELLETGGAFSVANALELETTFNELLQNEDTYNAASRAAGEYVKSKSGATEKVMAYIQENRLLTN